MESQNVSRLFLDIENGHSSMPSTVDRPSAQESEEELLKEECTLELQGDYIELNGWRKQDEYDIRDICLFLVKYYVNSWFQAAPKKLFASLKNPRRV
ncbi:hypothetical protein AVEN_50687-1 [Araneus ventricosus]|uniref:Uncharacterized protein n=1 Tax=Araneus ventricosus TaxID=182803 RepID=A0A4Y2M4E9_ARAVE|nr:hypothetical protein AVEN_50687-1 [Araneus ventricosus]